MPTKGLFTQGVAVLLKQKVTLDDIEPLLKEHKIVKRKDDFEQWEFGGPTLIVEYRPEVNGLVSIDIVDREWPDHMGDSKLEVMLLGAWALGHFGPCVFPGNYERARKHCYHWNQGAQAASQHQAFIRIRVSYSFGLPKDGPVMPKDYQAVAEFNFVLKLVMDLLRHPSAICYFNPNGEFLAERSYLEKVIAHYNQVDLPPVDLVSNRRVYKFNEEWMFMDTVGMRQLDLDDLEVCFKKDRFKAADIGQFLANTSLYLTGAGKVIKDGETIDGPGKVLFRAKHFDEGKVAPPRATQRFHPLDGTTPPPEFGFEVTETKKKWQFWK